MASLRTLAELKAAYDSGEILRDNKLYLDNDSTSLYLGETGPAAFSMHPEELLEQALDLLGIPYDHV